MNFKELRQFIGYEQGRVMTCDDMAKMIGVTNSAWGEWESGKAYPLCKSFIAIAKAFNVTVSIFPDGEISFDRE